MTVKTNIFSSRVAQRILVLFIIASLLPVTLFSGLSYRYLQNHLYDSTKKELIHARDQYHSTINERIHVTRHELDIIRSKISQHGANFFKNLDKIEREKYQQYFDNILLIDAQNKQTVLFGEATPLSLSINQKILLQSGDTLLDTSIDQHNQPAIRYYESVIHKDISKGIIIAKLNHKYLFKHHNLNSQNIHACIIAKNTFLTKCPLSSIRSVLEKTNQADHAATRGAMTTEHAGKEYILSFERLQLQSSVRNPEWTLIVAKSSTHLSHIIMRYSTTFMLIILISLLIVMLLSFSQIRHIIIPLAKLQEGTRSIANQRFNTLVNIKSGDEFEELADSFNRMSIRLGKQFNALETMARIDRMILSTLDINNIIETILVRMVRIVPCNTVSIVVINEQGSKLYHRQDPLSIEISENNVKLSHEDIQTLINHPDSVLIRNKGKIPGYLSVLRKNHQAFLLLPIFLQGRLTAAIILGYYGEPHYTTDDLTHARDLAHRVAVALSNAAWEDKLYFKAHYDALTELPNRLLFQDRLQHALTRAERDKTLVALMFIDMDRFKSINDTLGHDAGDDFLVETAQRLRHCVRGIDTVSRLGGDEFTIIIPDLSSHLESTTGVANIAQKILESTQKPYLLRNQEVFSSASIGIAIYPSDASNYTELLKNSDSAMYYAKSSGKGQYKFYSDELNAQAKNLILLDNQLQQAIELKQFELYYQPRVHAQSGEIHSAQALIRWNHPQQGVVESKEFIEFAKESGLIHRIGHWMIEEACRQLKLWQQQGINISIAINISGTQFQSDDIINQIKHAIQRYDIEPQAIEFEISEAILMEHVEQGIEILNQFHQLGVKLCIDDFGTGSSSLNYLKWFPIDSLKIDQTFIKDIESAKENSAIVRAVTYLAHSLQLKVIAEGVETRAELNALVQLKCDEIQGYYFSKPLNVAAFDAYYQAHTLDKESL